MYNLTIDGYTIERLTYKAFLTKYGGIDGLKKLESMGFRLIPINKAVIYV